MDGRALEYMGETETITTQLLSVERPYMDVRAGLLCDPWIASHKSTFPSDRNDFFVTMRQPRLKRTYSRNMLTNN